MGKRRLQNLLRARCASTEPGGGTPGTCRAALVRRTTGFFFAEYALASMPGGPHGHAVPRALPAHAAGGRRWPFERERPGSAARPSAAKNTKINQYASIALAILWHARSDARLVIVYFAVTNAVRST